MLANGVLKDDPRIESVLKNFEDMPAEIDFMQLSFALKGRGVQANPWLSFYKKVMSNNLLVQDWK